MNTIQDIQFELMERSSFNGFEGKEVVASLKSNSKLWRGVIMDRAVFNNPDADAYTSAIDLIKLRDIEDNNWNVDTIFILPKAGKEKELLELAKTWGADEVSWMENAGSFLGIGGRCSEQKVLRVWFD